MFEPRRTLSSLLEFIRAHAAEFLSGVLLAIMCIQMFAVIWRKSITIDELVLIPSAYYHLVDGDFQLVNEHPAAPKLIAAIPLLFIQPKELSLQNIPSTNPSNVKWARQSGFWEANRDKFESMSFWPRVTMLILTLGLGVLIFYFTRTLFGSRAATFAVALFSLEPTVLGHGRAVHTDVPAALGYLLFFIVLQRYVSSPTRKLAMWLGAAAAFAILTKFSMLVLGFVIAGLFIFQLWRSSDRRLVVIHAAITFVSVLFVVNAAYFFHHNPVTSIDNEWIASNFPKNTGTVQWIVNWLSYLLPKEFVLGIFFQFWHNREGHSASLLGMYSDFGWWYYFPVAFALKTTIPFLMLTLGSIAVAAKKMFSDRDARFFWLLLPIGVYIVFVLFSHINIGVRYLLPMFPFLFILGGWLLNHLWESQKRMVGVAVVIVILGWIGVEAIRTYPNHIPYMNQFAIGKPHWWYLSDSNVEWGDDLHDLARYLHNKGETKVVDATLGGFGVLPFYGIERIDALAPTSGHTEHPSYIAVGASFLNGSTIPGGPPGSGRDTLDSRVNYFQKYRTQTPEAIIGDSIYVFRMR